MKKTIILTIMSLCLIATASLLASAETVYQENANSTFCDGYWFDSWGYTCSNTIDGNWSSYGMAHGGYICWANIYINYTKLGIGAIWQVKDGLTEINLTIPASCFDYDENTLILNAWSYSNEGLQWQAGWECYNGSWQTIRDTTLSSSWNNGKIYEEGIYWDTSILPNCTSNWTCDDYGECNINNTLPCIQVADLNMCGTNFTGNITDYDTNCTYVPPTIQYRESSDLTGAVIDNGTKIIVGFGRIALLFGLAIAGIGVAYGVRKLIIKK